MKTQQELTINTLNQDKKDMLEDVGYIKVNLVAVGLLFVSNPLVVVEALLCQADAAPPFHENVLPFATVAINTCPKLSNDHKPGSKDTSEAVVQVFELIC